MGTEDERVMDPVMLDVILLRTFGQRGGDGIISHRQNWHLELEPGKELPAGFHRAGCVLRA